MSSPLSNQDSFFRGVHRPEDSADPVQLSLVDLGQPLVETTFVVVDLETTGTGETAEITEIGAVKVRGGEVLGEFQSLVRPAASVISPYVERLTGITNGMVQQAPLLDAILPAFLEFSHGAVMVAHNAPFDMGFLRRACITLNYPWPRYQVVDTVKIARVVLSRQEVRNHKLSTLAQYFATETAPDHRALSDARATVDVLHGLISRLGSQGVFSLEELKGLTSAVTARQRRKSYLAEGLPTGPGVYCFLDDSGRVLYIGTSINIRKRVKSYFTASETRSRMGEMVQLAQSVRAIECPTVVEATIREVRMIAEHKPPYNRRSRHPERKPYLKLTNEEFPRLSVVRAVTADADRGALYIGPFASTHLAKAAKRVVETIGNLRTCIQKVSRTNATAIVPCSAASVGRCGGPCAGIVNPEHYAAAIAPVVDFMSGNGRGFWTAARARMTELAVHERFEEAQEFRDGALAFLRAVHTTAEHQTLAVDPELVAAARSERGWEVAVIKHGRLAASALSPNGSQLMQVISAAVAMSDHVEPPRSPQTAASAEETSLLYSWLCKGQTRLARAAGPLALDIRLGADRG